MIRNLFSRLAAALFAAGLSHQAALAADPVLVATSLQPLYSIGAALAAGTNLSVVPVPATLPGMPQLSRILGRASAANDAVLKKADAIIDIASFWPEDPLFRIARARNIRVVEIDAGRTYDKETPRVALIAQPVSNVPWRQSPADPHTLPWAWFAPANAIRMAGIVAADFKALSPGDAARIAGNLTRFVTALQELKADFEAKFASVVDPHLFALSDHFTYLTNEFGLDLEGSFLEEDVRWTDQDRAAFTAFLRERGARTVLHHWKPDDSIVKAIEDAKAKLLILDDGENSNLDSPPATPDPQGYQKMMLADLAALEAAIRATP